MLYKHFEIWYNYAERDQYNTPSALFLSAKGKNMKFKKILSVLTVICVFTLSGCASWFTKVSHDPADLYPFPTGSYDEPKPYVLSHDYATAEELAAAVEAFPIENILLPDGSTVSKYDAVSGGECCWLSFDFGFYEIAPPNFGTSFENPDIIKTGDDGKPYCEFNLERFEMDFRKTVKGDVLENGLVVDHACCGIYGDGEFYSNYVFLKGEVTLSGYLAYEFHPAHWLSEANGSLWFMPDTTNGDVPSYCDPNQSTSSFWRYWGDYESNKPYVLYSGSCPWMLGNTKDEKYAPFDLQSLFNGKSYVAVSVTVKDPILGYQGSGYLWDNNGIGYFGEMQLFGKYASGTIVDIQPL